MLQILGTIGDLTFRQTKYGIVVQRKSSLTKAKMRANPKCKKSLGASNEFTLACKGAKILRDLFIKAIGVCYDNELQSRLVTALRQVINSDKVSTQGEKNLLMGDNRLLRGFDWNRHSNLGRVFGANYRVSVNRQDGEVKFCIPSFIPLNSFPANPGATHFKIHCSTAELNWREDVTFTAMQSTDYLPLNDKPTLPIDFVLLVNENNLIPIASCMAITWYKEVNGKMHIKSTKKYNAAGIVDVS